jgi:hypothetical protein
MFCADLQAIILQLFNGLQWHFALSVKRGKIIEGPFTWERQLLALCCDPFTFKASRPAPMFPPLFEGRLKNGMKQFFSVFYPLKPGRYHEKKRKKIGASLYCQ